MRSYVTMKKIIMATLYTYVGPAHIRTRAATLASGRKIESVQDLDGWMRQTGQRPNQEGIIVVTFVVDDQGDLRIADRGSEHIACSGGRPVRSAGEISFARTNKGWQLEEVSNQSTGFCPEPESWSSVAAALDRLGIQHPGTFTLEVIFRRCSACGERNIVKDGWFVCDVCGADLPMLWNFGEAEGRNAT